ncbi:uncharacterized protein [Typha angustifolia]|uniref:uncharacterized protein n=1 Tax=Typha angustifolia TaxID=59011 RepID=UPI003C2B6419
MAFPKNSCMLRREANNVRSKATQRDEVLSLTYKALLVLHSSMLIFLKRVLSTTLYFSQDCFTSPSQTMDSIKSEKLQAIRRYKMKQFLSGLMTMHALASVLALTFHARPSWLPKLCSLSRFFSVCLPSIGYVLIIPKWFFIIVNIIIIFLVCEPESKLSTAEEEEPDMQEEYVERRASLRGMATGEDKRRQESTAEDSLIEEEEKDGEVVEKTEEQEEERSHGRACLELDGEEEEEIEKLSAEEFNRRVEDFIANMNMQMRSEAREANLSWPQ